jgi:hypothetical protein
VKKKVIKKKIEIINGKKVFIENENVLNKKKIYIRDNNKIKTRGNIKSKADIKLDKRRASVNKKVVGNNIDSNISITGTKINKNTARTLQKVTGEKHHQVIQQNTNLKYFNKQFRRKAHVDFDVVFCVSSFNRYEKLERILKQLFSQDTKYTFKFILLNDGSSDSRYDNLKYLYPDILYLNNKTNGGKINYWRSVNQMWNHVKNIETYGIIQLDDDFILCNSFIDRLLDKFFEMKEKNNLYMAFTFHLYNFSKTEPIEDFWFDENKKFVDGGMLLDVQFLEYINYKLDKIEHRVKPHTSTFTWVRVKEILEENGLLVYRTRNSLVFHDGNDDSKLHYKVRVKKRVYTKNFIDKDFKHEQ